MPQLRTRKPAQNNGSHQDSKGKGKKASRKEEEIPQVSSHYII